MRLSSKQIVVRTQSSQKSIGSDFDKDGFFSSIGKNGYDVIHEKAYLCPCKSQDSPAPLSICKNCGGTGWLFANPTQTKMIITGIMLDDKLKEGPLREWGELDKGACKITCLPEDKLSYMDRIRNIDATAEHMQILYPKMDDDDIQLFAYTKYDIKGVDFIGLFQDENTKLKRLVEFDDYTFRDNVILLDSQYNTLENPKITIRYIHNPEYHIIDILRESMTQYAVQGQQKQILPLHAIAMRAHLIPDVENFDGDRLLDNSWLPNACEQDISSFIRQLKYTSAQDIYDNLTAEQLAALTVLINA